MNRYKYTDLAGEHLHTLDGRPLIGTSRVAGAFKTIPGWYASGKAVEVLGVTDPKVLTRIKNGKATSQEKTDHMAAMRAAHSLIKGMDTDQYCAMIDQAYRAHDTYMRSRAKVGTDLHAELQRFVRDEMSGQKNSSFSYDDKILPFIDWSFANVKRFLWSEGHCYSDAPNWIGGICDVGYEKHDGTLGIGDFKSAKDAYFEHHVQIGGYDTAISENGVLDADGNLLYTLEKPVSEYIVVPFGAETVKPVPNYDVAGMRECFQHMLALYKKKPQD